MPIKMGQPEPDDETTETPEYEAAEVRTRAEAARETAKYEAKIAKERGTQVKTSKTAYQLSTQDKPPAVDPLADAVEESYLWLANGDVLRVLNEDIPVAGHLSLGHWQRGDKVYQVVGVYPVEDKGIVE